MGPTRTQEHLDARRHAFDLVRWSQTEEEVSPEAISALIDHGRVRGWPDVVRLGAFAQIVYARYVQHTDPHPLIDELMTLALDGGDPAALALAHAVRALDRTIREGRAPADADRDLARATALLEGVDYPSSEAVTAHIQCGLACEAHELWELQLSHYAAAEARLDPLEDPEIRRATLRYNSAEVQLNWLVAVRELQDDGQLAERAERARQALRDADLPQMPPLWRDELAIFGDLVDSICPPAGERVSLTRVPEGSFRGYVHLALALREPDPNRARAHCSDALEALHPALGVRMRGFAFALAAELEAHLWGRETDGLRFGRELLAQRSERRIAMLATIQSLVAVERSDAERAQLRRHAYLDELTGLGNRRALSRFTTGLREQGATTATVAVLDLDHFKEINDTLGHATGDAVLVRTAELMRSRIREQDLVVRLGGDEFLMLLAVDDPIIGRRRCEAVHDAIDREPWARISGDLRPSASLGVAHGALDDLDALISVADRSLYRAKRAGRNRIAA